MGQASADDAVAAFYRANGYEPLWTDPGEAARARRAALLDALSGAGAHGLPLNRYDPGALMQQMRAVRTTRDLGLVEVALSRAFLGYARDVQSGILTPSRVDEGIVREVKYRDATAQLTELAAAAAPSAYMRGLAPRTAEYRALMKQKMRLEDLIASGGWGGTVPGGKYAPGESGARASGLSASFIAWLRRGRSSGGGRRHRSVRCGRRRGAWRCPHPTMPGSRRRAARH